MSELIYNPPLFGISINPTVKNTQLAFTLAQVADTTGFDFITIQDHPYNPTFLDTWTLLAAIGARTQQVRLLPNVVNLPLRPPAMLAKAAATLDILTGGRMELGLGAGAFWEGVVSYGGPARTPGEAVRALEESIQVIRALWQPVAPGHTVSFAGKFYQLNDAQPGPTPAHSIGIWLGVMGQRMLGLTGRLADGWIISAPYVPPENVLPLQAAIDDAAQSAGRSTTAIRRAYNLAGAILRPGAPAMMPRRRGIITGPVNQWVDELSRYYRDLHLDTFIFWPIGDEEAQVRLFAEEVIPALRSAIAK